VSTSINHLGELLAGRAPVTFVVQVGLTYIVPFCVSNYGALAAIRSDRAMSWSRMAADLVTAAADGVRTPSGRRLAPMSHTAHRI
jgi:hypothetical protein